MNRRFFYYLKIVTAFHVVAVAVLVVASGWRKWFGRKRETTVPVEFVVEVPPAPPAPEKAAPTEKERRKQPPVPKEEPTTKAKPKSREIERSKTKVTRRTGKETKRSLSEAEIRKLLLRGAKRGDYTKIPNEDLQNFELIRRALYSAWNQPSAEEVGGAMADISVRLHKDGGISDPRLATKSGSALLDESAMAAARSVRRIPGLSTSFLSRHDEITISFRLE